MSSNSFYCYLLKSIATPKSSATYIGFTTSPERRLRQHNGELVNGARRTSKRRPWVHVCVVSGFPNKIVALQFEWQWQHPFESRILKHYLDGQTKSGRGFKTNLTVLRQLLLTPLWRQLELTIHFLENTAFETFRSGIEPSETLSYRISTYNEIENSAVNRRNDDIPNAASACSFCLGQESFTLWSCSRCACSTHITCLAANNKGDDPSSDLIPISVRCMNCHRMYSWLTIIRETSIGNGTINSDIDSDDDDGVIGFDSDSDFEETIT